MKNSLTFDCFLYFNIYIEKVAYKNFNLKFFNL